MNGRACQLCGKPLSRLRPSGGGDFCSREHRNQYRLRAGMDTLLEANKHASLMRRRDQLRQFPAQQLQANGAPEPRASEAQRIGPGRPAVRRMPSTITAFQPAMEATGDYIHSLTARETIGAAREAAKSGVSSAKIPILPSTQSRRMPVAIARGGMVGLNLQQNPPAGRRRGFFMFGRNRARLHWPERPFPGFAGQQSTGLQPVRGRKLKSTANGGNRFRVSLKNSFRRPELRLKHAALPGPDAPEMAWPKGLPLPGNTHPGRGSAPRVSGIRMPQRMPLAPDTPEVFTPHPLTAGSPVPLPQRTPYELRLDVREANWLWSPVSGPQLGPVAGLRPRRSETGPQCLPVPVRPAGTEARHRVESAQFQPAEQPWIAAPSLWNPSR